MTKDRPEISDGYGCCAPTPADVSEERMRELLKQNQYRLMGGGVPDGLEGDLPVAPLPFPFPGGGLVPSNCCTFDRDQCEKEYFCRTTNNCGRYFQRHRWYYRWKCTRVCNSAHYHACTDWKPTPEGAGEDLCCQWSDGPNLPPCTSTEPQSTQCVVFTVVFN